MQKRCLKAPKNFLVLSCFIFFITSSVCGMDKLCNAVASTFHVCCPRCMIYPDTQAKRLADAIDADDTQTITWLFNRRAIDPNMPLENEAPVIRAAKQGNCDALKALLTFGAHPDSQYHDRCNNQYPSALIAACLPAGRTPESVFLAVSLLLNKGANPALKAALLTNQEEKEFLTHQEKIAQEQKYLYMPIVVKTPEYKRPAPRTALEFARLNGYTLAAKLLENSSAK